MIVAAFSFMVDGKNDELSTSELSGGARIHYIFQSIFVKCLEVIHYFVAELCLDWMLDMLIFGL